MPPALFSKSLEAAFAAAALLAEVYDGSATALTADQIAARQRLPRPFVAKLLTALSQAGIVSAKRGRGGGFALARAPERITLLDVAAAIDHPTQVRCCAFGPEYGEGRPRGHCPLHEQICALRQRTERFLATTTLGAFRAARRRRSRR